MRSCSGVFFAGRRVRPSRTEQQALLGDDMKNTMKTLIKIVLGSLGVVVAVAIAVAGYLIYPGTPSSAPSLQFQGYVPLPSDSVLSVLDYLTVNDDQLFVTAEGTGDVDRVH